MALTRASCRRRALLLTAVAVTAALALESTQAIQFTDVRMHSDDVVDTDNDSSSTSAPSIASTATASKFTLEAAEALATPHDSSTNVTHVAVSDAEAKQATAGGYVAGNWTSLDASAYHIDACAPQTWNVTKSKVTSLWLRFSSIAAAGDAVVVSTRTGEHAQTFDDAPNGVVTAPIAAKSLQIAFRPAADRQSGCAVSGVVPSMTLDAVGFHWSKEMLVTKENVCGAKDTMKNAVCANANGNTAQMYAKARAVLRTERTREDGALVTCSAWLWGNKGHIVTNNHCFHSQAMVDAARFQFGVETAGCSDSCQPGACPVAHVIAGATNVKFIRTDAKLDVTLLQLVNNPHAIIAQYGYLKIRFGAPTKGEAIYIPQHPFGGAKKIAWTDDDADVTHATIHDTTYAITMGGQKYENLIGYAADTAGGSSGSPVIATRDHLVVGLHRIGDCNNAGTASNYLVAPLMAAVGSDIDGLA